jgi:hypothetical protein
VEAYNAAINEAIKTVADRPLIRAVDETIPLITDTVEYTIPAGFSFLSKVSWRDTTVTPSDWAELAWRDDWALVPGANKLRVPRATTNLRLRLEGHLAPPALLRDAAYCDVRPSYLKFQAANVLVQSEIAAPGRDLHAAAQYSAWLAQQAKSEEPKPRDVANARRV